VVVRPSNPPMNAEMRRSADPRRERNTEFSGPPPLYNASCRTHLTLWVEDAIPVTCSCVAANSVQR